MVRTPIVRLSAPPRHSRINLGVAAITVVFALAVSIIPEAAQGTESTASGLPTQFELTIDRAPVKLAATLTIPPAPEPVAAVVVIHGSGTSDRSNAWTAAWTSALVARGVAVLHPDKRGSGASGGDWQTVSFDVLAADAVAAVRVIAARPEIDASRIGVIGFSQGGMVAPVAAADDMISFAIAVSSSVLPFDDQVRDEVVLAARRAGLDSRQVDRVGRLQDTASAYAHSKIRWEEYAAELAETRDTIPDSDVIAPFPATEDHWVWSWVRSVGDFDPIPRWQALDVPSLFIWGGRDPRIDTVRNVALATYQLASDDRPVTILFHGDEGHAFIRDDTLDFVARWILNGGKGDE